MRKIIRLLTLGILVMALPACSGSGFGVDGSIITGGASLGQDDGDDYDDATEDDTAIEDIDLSDDTDAIITDGVDVATDSADDETDDTALDTDGVVDQDTTGANAATDDSRAESTSIEDEFDSSTGPVALPATPPKEEEGSDCESDQAGEITIVSLEVDEDEMVTYRRQMGSRGIVGMLKNGIFKDATVNNGVDIHVKGYTKSHVGEVLVCTIDSDTEEHTWQHPSATDNLGIAVTAGADVVKTLKLNNFGIFSMRGRELPINIDRVSFLLYDKTTGIIF